MLRMRIEGQKAQVEQFFKEFKRWEKYHIYSQNHLVHTKEEEEEIQVDCYFSRKTKNRKYITVELELPDGRSLSFDLLDPHVIPLGQGTTYVLGKHYDIFA